MAIILSLEIQTTSLLTNFATSAFAQHSLLSTVFVVQGVINGMGPNGLTYGGKLNNVST